MKKGLFYIAAMCASLSSYGYEHSILVQNNSAPTIDINVTNPAGCNIGPDSFSLSTGQRQIVKIDYSGDEDCRFEVTGFPEAPFTHYGFSFLGVLTKNPNNLSNDWVCSKEFGKISYCYSNYAEQSHPEYLVSVSPEQVIFNNPLKRN